VNTSTQPSFCYAPSRHLGFTLVELLVAVSIAAILLAVGIPSFRSAIASNRLTSTTNDLVGSLAQARSEAIRRGVRVTVCKSNAAGTDCDSTRTWAQGWISFVDTTRTAGTTAAKVDTGEVILAVTQRDASSILVVPQTSVAQFVSFSSDGTARVMAGTMQAGTLRLCEPSSALTNANRARDIEISSVGRLSTTTPDSVSNTCPAPT
jgi:type IV fimbrial biogenesis protein FimT